MNVINVRTDAKRQVLDITDLISREITIESGVVHIFAQHTTVGVSVADMDPGTDEDYLNALFGMVPDIDFNHPHDPSHTPSHILSVLLKPDVTVPIDGRQLQLGTWQRVVLLEFDGPRERSLALTFLS